MIEFPRGFNSKSHLHAAAVLWSHHSGWSRPLRSLCILSTVLVLWGCTSATLWSRASHTQDHSVSLGGPRTSKQALSTRQTLQQIAQKIAQNAVDLLESGQVKEARADVKRSLLLDPTNKLALSLKRQMKQDPVATLGRESFTYALRSGDTLSRIAGRYMGDIYAFHILARYNNIKVPKLVSEGQVILVPGKPAARTATVKKPARAVTRRSAKPKAEPVSAPPPLEDAASEAADARLLADRAIRSGDEAASAGQIDTALAHYNQAESLGHPEAALKAQAALKQLIDYYSRAARTSMARQDLEGAIRAWDRVLELDPEQEIAQLERQKALRLSEKIRAL